MSSNIITARVQLLGIRDLLQHRFGPSSIPLDGPGERTGVAGNDPEEWRKTCMVTPDGQLYIEPTYVFRMIVDGAKHTKKGKGSIQALVAATVQVEDQCILLANRRMPKKGDPQADPSQDVYLHVSGVKNPQTKGMNVRYRVAARAGWKLAFTINWDKTIVNRDQMRAVLNDAGLLVGLADGRKIGFGRFSVEEFKILAETQAAA
jgi:hypothetical protein